MNRTLVTSLISVVVVGGALAAYQGLSQGKYAEVVSAIPVTEKEPVFAEVVGVRTITETLDVSREVCETRQVEKRRPERFGDKDGMIAGAVIGGLLGNQIGGGNGRTLATVAGAAGGAYAGREIDRRHQGGQRYTDSERVCHTVNEPQKKTVGYDVQYRLDGQLAITRMLDKPEGPQVQVGERDRIVGYDVTWRYDGKTGSLRMDHDPGQRLPIEDNRIVVAETVRTDRG